MRVSFRFRRSIQLFPGVRLNLSGAGYSVSVGKPGAMINLRPKGGTLTLGLPGSGLSYRQSFTFGDAQEPTPVNPLKPSDNLSPLLPDVSEIQSAAVATLTSPDLSGLKTLINEARAQRDALKPDLDEALKDRVKAWRRLRRREQFPLRPLMKRSIPMAQAAFTAAEEEARKVTKALAASCIAIQFAYDEKTLASHRALEEAHSYLARSERIWDITSALEVDRVRDRSSASTAYARTPVSLTTTSDSPIVGAQKCLRFQNANGPDLDIFAGFLLMRDGRASEYALIDLRELQLEVKESNFIENDLPPIDAEKIGEAWEKSNLDGSPDRRFKENRRIPVMRYGSLSFSTASGVSELYLTSNCDAAFRFAEAFKNFQGELWRLAHSGEATASALPLSTESQAIDAPELPPLPTVYGAHEFTALAALVVCAPIALNTSNSPTSSPQPAAPMALIDVNAESAKRATTNTITEMLTRRPANIRLRPEASSQVVRTVPQGAKLRIFETQLPWFRVGDSAPWGWTHESVFAHAR